MRTIFDRRPEFVVATIATIIFALAAALGGSGAIADVDAIQWLGAARAADAQLTSVAIAITAVGGAPAMTAILLGAMAILASRHRLRLGLALGMIVLGGRIAVELLKLAIDRQRPHFGPYPVEVASLSFPSGHAANSMITFLALALIATPAKYRGKAVAAAVSLSVIIGATRPYLGVHWPSDVIGGWAFGIAWVTALSLFVKQQHEVVGGHRPAID